jgi:high-affinity nickel permease
LEVGFQFHLPYKTTNGEDTLLLIATGLHVSVNTILGLPFMQGSGMILNLVDNLAECKYLGCPPFLIDF